MKKIRTVCPVLALGLILTAPVVAFANDLSGQVALGVGMTPDYAGSDDYQAIPFISARLQQEEYWVQLRGLEASANIINSETFNFGPVLNYRFGRDDDVDNDVVSRLQEIDDAFEAGLFASYTIPDVGTKGANVTLSTKLLHDLSDGHEGLTGDLGLSYSRPITEQLMLTGSVSGTFGSDDYMDSYFGVNASNRGTSGLANYEAEAGFQDVGVSLMANYALNENWGLFGMVGYSELIGDAKDSPIVDQQGDSTQTFTAVGVSYRF